MNIQHNISLKPYNTFGIDVKAIDFISVSNLAELQTVLKHQNSDLFLLGGGSNMLLTKDITNKLVIHLNLKGKEIIKQNEDFVWIKANAGENWHEFILWCLDQDFGGLENMSLIPGNIGTAPIQNIGAYGKELKDNFIECEAVEITSGKVHTFSKENCQFGYRNSIFKNELKDKYIITSVTFKLTKQNHQLNTSYGAIESELDKQKVTNPSIKDISNAVITIRQSKLPDPKELGNSGSFFKNPVISQEDFKKFISKFPEAPSYRMSDSEVKIPAGWLIEQTGFKGKRFGDAGVHKNQALVLVNYNNATGEEIWDLAMKIKTTVLKKFNIEINPEVNIY
ncbi:UDP-N-acetylmuramate dehydrogenase [Pseudofulvibacter geojedonensis]|uniref:UDP-N-acetylenolpyruvoylglucosamine reductase n=1 Tax=Pseudofulvibacter geojedonensis TaxID=1123758 RepID=A0ABW3I559_9FLAO